MTVRDRNSGAVMELDWHTSPIDEKDTQKICDMNQTWSNKLEVYFR